MKMQNNDYLSYYNNTDITRLGAVIGSGKYIDTESILQDLKFLFNEYFFGTFTMKDDGLKVKFENNQEFIIKVTQCN